MLMWKFFTKHIWELELHSAFSFAKRLFSESFTAASAIVFQCKLSLFPFFSFFVNLVSFLSSWFPEGNNLSGSTAKNVITKAHTCCFNFRIKRLNLANTTSFNSGLLKCSWQEEKVNWLTQVMLINWIRNLCVNSFKLLKVANIYNNIFPFALIYTKWLLAMKSMHKYKKIK